MSTIALHKSAATIRTRAERRAFRSALRAHLLAGYSVVHRNAAGAGLTRGKHDGRVVLATGDTIDHRGDLVPAPSVVLVKANADATHRTR